MSLIIKKIDRLNKLLRVISEVDSLPIDDDKSRITAKAIRELIEFLPEILDEFEHWIIERATLLREIKHRQHLRKDAYRRGFIEATKIVSETEAISPTSKDVLNKLIDHLEEKINNL